MLSVLKRYHPSHKDRVFILYGDYNTLGGEARIGIILKSVKMAVTLLFIITRPVIKQNFPIIRACRDNIYIFSHAHKAIRVHCMF